MRNSEQAARAAENQNFNQVGMCQLTTRTWLDAPSVGDVDRDGDGDAVDGWKSEPLSARHEGDRKPPRGRPVSWSGGSSGHGHRALSLGENKAGVTMIRSTDAGGPGQVATVPLDWFEKNWNLNYLGWSDTMSGIKIESPPKPPTRVDDARELLKEARRIAKDNGRHRRVKRIDQALDILPWR